MDYVGAAKLDEMAGYGNNPRFKSPLDRREFLELAGVIGYAAALAACGGGSSAIPTAPTSPTTNTAVLQVYNATTGQKKEMTVEAQSPRVTINAADLAVGLGDVVTSEFAVRNMGTENSLGSLVTAAGSQADIPGGTYEAFVPAVALLPNGQSIYDCTRTRNPSLSGDRRDFVVGVQNKPGVGTNGLPMYIWTDAINELNKHMQSDTGRRYGSIRFDANAANPDLTVGFANQQNPNFPGVVAWWEGSNTYMLGPGYRQANGFSVDYSKPFNKDTALEEIFEIIFRVDDICGTQGSSEVIGKAAVTGNTQWGLNDIGVHLLRRNFTRAR